MSDSESDSPPPPTAPVPVEHAASRPDEQADHHQHHHHHHRSSSGRTSHRSHRHEKHDHDGGDHGDADDADDDDDRDDDPTTASTSKHHKHASSGKGAHKQHSGRDGKHKHKHSVENNDDADADDDDPDADLGKHFGEYDITAANDDDAWPAEAASTAATYGYAIASYKCESEEDSKDQIDFTKGDKLKLYERDGKSGWWRADLHHKRGFILSGYVSVYFIDPWRYEADYGVRLPRLEDLSEAERKKRCSVAPAPTAARMMTSKHAGNASAGIASFAAANRGIASSSGANASTTAGGASAAASGSGGGAAAAASSSGGASAAGANSQGNDAAAAQPVVAKRTCNLL
jgi:hypothetical protein